MILKIYFFKFLLNFLWIDPGFPLISYKMILSKATKCFWNFLYWVSTKDINDSAGILILIKLPILRTYHVVYKKKTSKLHVNQFKKVEEIWKEIWKELDQTLEVGPIWKWCLKNRSNKNQANQESKSYIFQPLTSFGFRF